MARAGPPAVVLHLLLQIHFTICLFSIHPSSAGKLTGNSSAAVPVLCLPDQASALLRLKRSFTTTNYSVIAFRSWRVGTDCCRWVGVQCGDSDGRVTSLDLGDRRLKSGGLDPAFFHLTSLKYLNLAYNNFNRSQLPSGGFERLVKLNHLNLSRSSFSGQVPAAINSLTNLVSLDLSTGFKIFDLLRDGSFTLIPRLENLLTVQNFEILVRNLSNLRELHLGNVDLSSTSTQWCNILAKSCLRLQVVSLPSCSLSGPICSSFSRLHFLEFVDLQDNDLSGPLPDFLITNFSELTALQLKGNYFQGWISPAIFQHKKLVTIGLYDNPEISGHLPTNFSLGSRLENINVGKTNFSGTIPASLSNLTSLKELGLGASGFSGELPSSLGNLKSLRALEISGMGLVGSIPSWVANLSSLTTLRFHDCGLSGTIPYFVGGLRHLEQLFLCNCRFSGEIPSHISNLTQLQILLLYSNIFVGTVELTFFKKLVGLFTLDLSFNNLVVLDGQNNSSLTSFPKFHHISLAGCNMLEFPNFLRQQDEILWLDLSYNKIHGAIPRWAWELWEGIYFLILSNNEFTSVGYEPFLPIPNITVLDLSSNLFEGPIPIPQGSAEALSYSNNMFSSIPSNLSSHLSSVSLFEAIGNNLSGNISESFCVGTYILLDLSYNNFSGSIPSCLMENTNGMRSLNLRNNQLHGEIPSRYKEGCSFEALDFSSNQIEGQLPRSLVACKNLEILDVGNNKISDLFPCWMSELLRLQVLVLHSNKFFGQVAQPIQEDKSECAFPSATIVDVSSNNFFGPLPEDQWFKKLRSMVSKDPNMSLVMGHQVAGVDLTYNYTLAITYKGHDTTFAHIVTTLVFIDFSDNKFNGSIPAATGELGLLHELNISHNCLTGPIPSQLGHLNELETLDLSFNELSGEIPQELASLAFLSTLNLSYNRLVGSIPASPQFLTFSSSFEGNDGLCGPPLSKVCDNITTSSVVPSKKSVDVILFLLAGLGFGVGFAVAIVVAWGIPIRKRS